MCKAHECFVFSTHLFVWIVSTCRSADRNRWWHTSDAWICMNYDVSVGVVLSACRVACALVSHNAHGVLHISCDESPFEKGQWHCCSQVCSRPDDVFSIHIVYWIAIHQARNGSGGFIAVASHSLSLQFSRCAVHHWSRGGSASRSRRVRSDIELFV